MLNNKHLQTISEWLSENPHLDPFTIPEGERRFTEPGRHSVHLAGPMGADEVLEIMVYECGGYTILDHSITKHLQKNRA